MDFQPGMMIGIMKQKKQIENDREKMSDKKTTIGNKNQNIYFIAIPTNIQNPAMVKQFSMKIGR